MQPSIRSEEHETTDFPHLPLEAILTHQSVSNDRLPPRVAGAGFCRSNSGIRMPVAVRDPGLPECLKDARIRIATRKDVSISIGAIRNTLLLVAVLGSTPTVAVAQSPQDVLNMILNAPGGLQIPGASQFPGVPVVPVVPNAVVPGASSEIREMQRLLNAAGFDAGTADGMIGPSTLRAITAFQSSLGRPVTGRLTPDELRILRSASASPRAQPPNAVDAREAQALLAATGYDPGVVDGIWGGRSQGALDLFRRDRGIARTGPPTEADLDALRRRAQPVPQPLPAAPPEAVRLDLVTTAGDGRRLVSLPVVDRGAPFSVSWQAASPDNYWLAILPPGQVPSPGIEAWPFGSTSPTRISAPGTPGPYEITWIDIRDGSVLVRRPIEVR